MQAARPAVQFCQSAAALGIEANLPPRTSAERKSTAADNINWKAEKLKHFVGEEASRTEVLRKRKRERPNRIAGVKVRGGGTSWGHFGVD